MERLLIGKLGVIAILSLSLNACQKDQSATNQISETASAAPKSNINNPEGIIFYALAGNTLDKYSTSNPETIMGSATIEVPAGVAILGIDFRPKTGELYALGSDSRVYKINPTTGDVLLSFSLMSGGMPVMLMGTSFGFDFNPQVDRLRIISNTGQNLRVVPDGIMGVVAGTTFIDGSINPQPASVTGAAYDNNFAGTTSTELYVIDAMVDSMYEVKPPNNGLLVDPLAINLKLEGDGGFDIAPRNANVTTDIGLALYEVNKKSTLFRIDVETGETKILAKYNKDIMYTALAISPSM